MDITTTSYSSEDRERAKKALHHFFDSNREPTENMEITKLSIEDPELIREALSKIFNPVSKKLSITLFFTGFSIVPMRLVRAILLKRVKGITIIDFPEGKEFGTAEFSDEGLANQALVKKVNVHFKSKMFQVQFSKKRP